MLLSVVAAGTAPIPDTPENIARAILNTPPKAEDEWRYLQDEDND